MCFLMHGKIMAVVPRAGAAFHGDARITAPRRCIITFAQGAVITIAKRSHCERTTRFSLSAEDSQMEAKFAVGDRVDHSPSDRFVGIVKAVYMTKEGEVRYAVDVEGHGTLRLCSEHAIVAHNHQ
jgi:hypothetical protein